jgi:hypothetical protein
MNILTDLFTALFGWVGTLLSAIASLISGIFGGLGS